MVFLRKKWWLEPEFMASQTSALYGNVKYTAKIKTLHDGNIVLINARTPKTDKHLNK